MDLYCTKQSRIMKDFLWILFYQNMGPCWVYVLLVILTNQLYIYILWVFFQMENITSMLNVSSQMNPDGTNAYQFTIVPDSISKDVKSITLSFTVYIYLKTLTITAAGKITQCIVFTLIKHIHKLNSCCLKTTFKTLKFRSLS